MIDKNSSDFCQLGSSYYPGQLPSISTLSNAIAQATSNDINKPNSA